MKTAMTSQIIPHNSFFKALPYWLALVFTVTACGGGGGGSGVAVAISTDTSSQNAENPGSAISYHGDVRSILETKCVTCHREGGEAPFALDSFQSVESFRSAMVYALESETMPPEGFTALTANEGHLLLTWLGASDLVEGSPGESASTQYTWWRDTKSIIEQRCSLCHVNGGLAPFPLQSWSDVVAIGAAAQHSIANETMPPWNPTKGYTGIQNNLSLSREEKAILLDWFAGGAPEGNPADEKTIEPVGLEEVDWEIKLRMPTAYTPTVFPDEYRCFVVDWPEQELRYITASTFLPQVPAEIHHVFVTIIPPGDVEAYKAAELVDDKPGYGCFGDTRIPGELPTSPPADVLGWGPGINSKRLPAGTGIQIAPGSALALQIHFNTLTTEPLPEQSEMVFVTEPEVSRPGATGYVLDISNWIFGENMLIPAGEVDVSFQYEMPVTELKSIFNRPELGVGPDDPIAIQRASIHMHTLGKSSRLSLVRADGTEQVILDARQWDFDWQSKYLLEKEIIVQPDDTIRTQCVFDNTEKDQPIVDGQPLPVRDVRWGDGTTDEMCASTLFFTRVDEEHAYTPSVYIGRPEVSEAFAPGDLLPVELRINNFVLEEPEDHHQHGQHVMGNRGHYHLYLDSDDDSTEHTTDWRQYPVIRVPEDMKPGLHSLRVSLRSSDHQAMGIEDTIEFRVADGTALAKGGSSLISHDRWSATSEVDDAFAGHRPASIDCPPSTWGIENGALEVETGVCNYLSLQQNSLADISRGDRIRLVLWHQQLRNEEPGRAHVALAINRQELWQTTVPIPSDGGFYEVEFDSPRDFPADAEINFHLHNHGYNSWTLLSIERY